MQTKQQIEWLLGSAGVSPNHRLGQHFLIDLNLMRLLIESAGIRRDDIVLEVGCGTGSLTEAIAETAGKVVAVEYDDTLAEIASSQLGNCENVEVVNADVLESKNAICGKVLTAIERAKSNFDGRLILAANLPYNVAAAVMANLISGPTVADGMYVTVQKEVAERCTAAPGGKHYGTLSILMSATGEAKIIRKLKPSVFWPRPAVKSAMMSFVRNKQKGQQIHNIDFFREVVSLFMGHRRKMLKACVKLAEGRLEKVRDWGDIFARAFVEAHHRPEELSAENYISIANLCYEQLN